MALVVTGSRYGHCRPAPAVREVDEIGAVDVAGNADVTVEALALPRVRVGVAIARKACLPETEVLLVDVAVVIRVRKWNGAAKNRVRYALLTGMVNLEGRV